MKEFHNDWCSETIEKRRLQWSLDPNTVFLNHGSFGAVPKEIRLKQFAIDDQIESDPVHFMLHEYPIKIAQARRALADFIDASPEQLVFVRNATEGVNALVNSIRIEPGQELLYSNHGYNACNEAIRHAAQARRFKAKEWKIPWPEPSNSTILESLLEALTHDTRWVLLDHITSPTALRLPIERIISALKERDIKVIVDGAHAPGMLNLELRSLGADYYVGNLHKWVCNPRGTAFIFAQEPQDHLLPRIISHGSSEIVKPKLNRFCEAFDWPGTQNPSHWCVLPETLNWFQRSEQNSLIPIHDENMSRAQAIALHFQDHPIARTRLDSSQQTAMILLELRPSDASSAVASPNQPASLQTYLYENWNIQIPVIHFDGRSYLRISMQQYVRTSDIHALERALTKLLEVGHLKSWDEKKSL